MHVAFNIFVHFLKVGNDFLFLFLFCLFPHIFLQLQDGQWSTVRCSCYEPMPLSVERLTWNMNSVTVAFLCTSSTIKRMFSVLKLYPFGNQHTGALLIWLFSQLLSSPATKKNHRFTYSLSFEFVLIFSKVIDILQQFPYCSQFYRIFLQLLLSLSVANVDVNLATREFFLLLFAISNFNSLWSSLNFVGFRLFHFDF